MKRHFCPFQLVREYLIARGNFDGDEEQFFIFKDKSLVKPSHARSILKTILINLGLDANLYGMHSLKIGRSTDLINFNYAISEVQKMGRWRSNVIFKYIR